MGPKDHSRLIHGESLTDIRFLYTTDCQSHDEALKRLHQILNDEGVKTEVQLIRVETFDEAKRLKYPGSPTIMINGRDIDPVERSDYAPACRAYRLEDGRISPLPSMPMIRNAVRMAKAQSYEREPGV